MRIIQRTFDIIKKKVGMKLSKKDIQKGIRQGERLQSMTLTTREPQSRVQAQKKAEKEKKRPITYIEE